MHCSALFVALAAFAASVHGLAITAPADGAIFSPTGSITVSWSSVSSDPTDFELVYIDPTQKKTQILEASVQTSSGSIVVSAPAGGFPVGNNWTINAVTLPTTQNSGGGILSQSGQFNVSTTGAAATGATTSGAATNLPTTMSTVAVPTTTASVGTVTETTATGTIAGSATALNPTGTSGALGVFQVSGTLMALAVVAHAFML